MVLDPGIEEYAFTIGIVLSLLGLIVCAFFSKDEISSVLKEIKFTKKHLAVAIVIIALFVALELYLVKPTQQLFFDDAIYQAMGQQLLHSGQAWMCDYGTPTMCYAGEIFHEPIGTSFNLAIGYAIAGVSRNVTYAVDLVVACIALLFVFIATFMLLEDGRAALFAELLLALSPIMLVFAWPTTSDMPYLAYSLVAFACMLLYLKRRTTATMGMMLFSLSLAVYMKVDSLLLILVFFLMYIILDEKSIHGSIKMNAKRLWNNMLNTEALIVLLVFILVIAPMIIYSYGEGLAGDYGYQGTTIQNTCAQSGSTTAAGNFNLVNFQYNVCANVLFWFNAYKSQYVMQHALFTLIAVLGIGMMLFDKRRILLALGIWFIAFFLLYTAFYAGSVVYGVDWRFMLSLIAQVCIFGGYALSTIVAMSITFTESFAAKLRIRPYETSMRMRYVAIVALLILLSYSAYGAFPALGVNPSSIQQASDARFYENFVYNDSNLISNNCAVFSYDPTLFNINNKTAAQLSDIYDTNFYTNLRASHSCLVVDWGYWCYTPNNLCSNLNQTFTLTLLANETMQNPYRNFALYYVERKAV